MGDDDNNVGEGGLDYGSQWLYGIGTDIGKWGKNKSSEINDWYVNSGTKALVDQSMGMYGKTMQIDNELLANGGDVKAAIKTVHGWSDQDWDKSQQGYLEFKQQVNNDFLQKIIVKSSDPLYYRQMLNPEDQVHFDNMFITHEKLQMTDETVKIDHDTVEDLKAKGEENLTYREKMKVRAWDEKEKARIDAESAWYAKQFNLASTLDIGMDKLASAINFVEEHKDISQITQRGMETVSLLIGGLGGSIETRSEKENYLNYNLFRSKSSDPNKNRIVDPIYKEIHNNYLKDMNEATGAYKEYLNYRYQKVLRNMDAAGTHNKDVSRVAHASMAQWGFKKHEDGQGWYDISPYDRIPIDYKSVGATLVVDVSKDSVYDKKGNIDGPDLTSVGASKGVGLPLGYRNVSGQIILLKEIGLPEHLRTQISVDDKRDMLAGYAAGIEGGIGGYGGAKIWYSEKYGFYIITVEGTGIGSGIGGSKTLDPSKEEKP